MQIKEAYKGFEIRWDKNDPLFEQKKEAVKSIQGYRWRPDLGCWLIPKYKQTEVERLMKMFSVFGDPVLDLPQQIFDLPPMPELTIDIPLKRELFHYQGQGVAKGMEFKQFINGDKPGLGKTAQAIATAIGLQCKCILVICPKTVKYVWQREWKIVAGMQSIILGDKNNKSWVRYYEAGLVKVFITNFESLKKFFVKPGWEKPAKGGVLVKDIPLKDNASLFDCVIVDESHRIKEENTMTTKYTIRLCYKRPIVMNLTGTALINKPKDLIPQLFCINQLHNIVSHIPMPVNDRGMPTDQSGYNRFINRYCGGTTNGESNLKELQYRLKKVCYFSREKSEVLKDLPDKMRQLIYCDITNRAEYDIAAKKFVYYLKEYKKCDEKEQARKLRGGILVQRNILRNLVARGKIECVKECIKELIEADQKVVVFGNLKDVLEEVRDAFPSFVPLTGDENEKQREENIYNFQNRQKTNGITCTYGAGGVGVTLTTASNSVHTELPLTDAILEQSIDRMHRIGQKDSVLAKLTIGRDTIDEYVYERIIMRKRILSNEVLGTEMIDDEIIDDMLSFFDRTMKDVTADAEEMQG